MALSTAAKKKKKSKKKANGRAEGGEKAAQPNGVKAEDAEEDEDEEEGIGSPVGISPTAKRTSPLTMGAEDHDPRTHRQRRLPTHALVAATSETQWPAASSKRRSGGHR